MKRFITFSMFLLLSSFMLTAQDFKTDMDNAKKFYAEGKLEEAHFALMQAMQEIDIRVGQEVIKLLPAKMDTMNANSKDDQVQANSGFVGTTIHRSYGVNRDGDFTIITNSPLIGTVNSFLNTPMMGGMTTDGNTKSIKVQGYKAKLSKEDNGNGTIAYSVEVPLGNSLITYRVNNCTDKQIMDMMNTVPLQQIAKLIQ